VSLRFRRRRELRLCRVLRPVFYEREPILLTACELTFGYGILQMRNNLLRFDVRAFVRLLAYLACLALTPQAAQAQQEPAAKPAGGKWQTYRNERYGFHLSYPPDSQIHTRRDRQYQYVRIQNYEPDHQGDLQTGEYYLEVFIFDHRAGHKLPGPCRELVSDARPVKAGKVNALRGLGDHASDPGGTPFALCLQGVKVDVLVTATEEGELGPLANRILDSVRFGN
jgi:hypothetical protein